MADYKILVPPPRRNRNLLIAAVVVVVVIVAGAVVVVTGGSEPGLGQCHQVHDRTTPDAAGPTLDHRLDALRRPAPPTSPLTPPSPSSSSAPIASVAAMPSLAPPVAGTWKKTGPTIATFTPTSAFLPTTVEYLTFPAGPTGPQGTAGGVLAAPVTVSFTVGPGQHRAAAATPGPGELPAVVVHPQRPAELADRDVHAPARDLRLAAGRAPHRTSWRCGRKAPRTSSPRGR